MFDVRLIMSICIGCGSSAYVQLTKSIKLPFPPFIGLRLSDERALEISVVDWSSAREQFFCAIKTKTAYTSRDSEHQAQTFVKDGWQISRDNRTLRANI